MIPAHLFVVLFSVAAGTPERLAASAASFSESARCNYGIISIPGAQRVTMYRSIHSKAKISTPLRRGESVYICDSALRCGVRFSRVHFGGICGVPAKSLNGLDYRVANKCTSGWLESHFIAIVSG